jgi:molybdopterin-guanine dinucleotide biosynthesis protein A
MGRDKAFLTIRGRPLVSIAAAALADAGAADVHAVGGDVDRLEQLGLITHADRNPGEGPLDGLVQALRVAAHDVVVVLACDQPNVDGDLVGRLTSGLTAPYDAAVPVIDGMPQPLTASYARRAVEVLDAAYRRGERSPRRALTRLQWRALLEVEPFRVVDLDDPNDVARYAANDRSNGTDVAEPNESG